MAGRPTTWNKELEKKAWEYIEGAWETEGHAFPSAIGLCSYIERGKTLIYRWAHDPKTQFRDILDTIKEKQELVAWNRGMRGDYNANLTKLLLGKHGYHDRQELDHQSKDGSMSPDGLTLEQRKNRIQQLLAKKDG